MGEERDREGDHRHPPRERLAPAEVARDLQEGQARKEHERAAALRDLERKPLLELSHHGRLAGPDGREQVEDAHQADDERHDRVQVGPPQLAPPDGAPRVPRPRNAATKATSMRAIASSYRLTPSSNGPSAPPAKKPRAAIGSAQRMPARRSSSVKATTPMPRAPHAAGMAMRNPYAKRLARKEEAAPATHEADELLVARVLAEAPVQPRPAAEAGELEVELVGEGVGRHRHRDHDGKAK